MRENPSNDVGEPSQMLAQNLCANVRYTVTSRSTTSPNDVRRKRLVSCWHKPTTLSCSPVVARVTLLAVHMNSTRQVNKAALFGQLQVESVVV